MKNLPDEYYVVLRRYHHEPEGFPFSNRRKALSFMWQAIKDRSIQTCRCHMGRGEWAPLSYNQLRAYRPSTNTLIGA